MPSLFQQMFSERLPVCRRRRCGRPVEEPRTEGEGCWPHPARAKRRVRLPRACWCLSSTGTLCAWRSVFPSHRRQEAEAQGQSPVRVLSETHPAHSVESRLGSATPWVQTSPQPAAKRSLLRTKCVGGSALIGGSERHTPVSPVSWGHPSIRRRELAMLRLWVRSVQPREGGLVPHALAHTCDCARTSLTHSVTLALSSGMSIHKTGVPRECPPHFLSPREGAVRVDASRSSMPSAVLAAGALGVPSFPSVHGAWLLKPRPRWSPGAHSRQCI